jgi:peroxiredoxin
MSWVEDMPRPEDDGAAAHLPGRRLPGLTLPATDGSSVLLSALVRGRAVIYLYPMTGAPGVASPPGWDLIPGARGCTPESCGFRDHHADLKMLGAQVYGLSSQSTDYQREAVERLRLPFPLLSDERFALAGALSLPTFTVNELRLYKRLTLIVRRASVEHVFYPVFPPDQHAEEVVAWLRDHSAGGQRRDRETDLGTRRR